MNKNEQDFITYDVVKDAIDPTTKMPLVDSNGSTMERYNAFRNNKVDYDADSSIEAVVMYEKIFPFINQISEKSVCSQTGEYNKFGLKFELRNKEIDTGFSFRGDTMNTVATTNREYCRLINRLQPVNPHWTADEIKWPKEALEFIDAYHTPGNFWILPYIEGMSVNCARGIGAARDYFDLFLCAVYNYFLSLNRKEKEYDRITLKKILSENTVRLFEIYLNSFLRNDDADPEIYPLGSEKIKNNFRKNQLLGWKEFIDDNLLQDYVEVNEDGSYGAPKELWEGHFTTFNDTFYPYPITTNQFIEFWVNATSLIKKRGARIYAVLHSEEESLRTLTSDEKEYVIFK